MDDIDRAQDCEQRDRDAALAAHRARTFAPRAVNTTCMDCDAPIGTRRREAHPGAWRCIDCQSDWERRHD